MRRGAYCLLDGVCDKMVLVEIPKYVTFMRLPANVLELIGFTDGVQLVSSGQYVNTNKYDEGRSFLKFHHIVK